jgi:formylglycine-generating enzyme required for sulfatase activity
VDGNDGSVVNNTISRNEVAPRFVKIPGNTSGSPEYRHYIPGNSLSISHQSPYIKLDDFYLATTETTQGQYASFLAAIDVSETYCALLSDWKDMCNAKTPMSGYTEIAIKKYLGMTADDTTTPPAMFTASTSTAAATATFYLNVGGTPSSKSAVYYANEVTSLYPNDPLVREKFPMMYVSWYGALGFCAWIGGMLPTEAQWEYAACRTSTGLQTEKAYVGGATTETELKTYAWYSENSGSDGGTTSRTHHEVATRQPIYLGLYDMGGNTREW